MIEQNFGHKELYSVVLRAKTPMIFGDREIVAEEPILYFDNVNMSLLNETNQPKFARGGWGNMPHVIWEDRSEITFQMIEGVMSNVGMGILMSAKVLKREHDNVIYINKKEGPLDLVDGCVILSHMPVSYNVKKTFIFDYDRKAIQQKLYGRFVDKRDPFDPEIILPCIEIFEDKNLTIPVENSRKIFVDYYYEYRDEALIYSLERERFNGLFTLEGKFYSKDENEGKQYTNILYMPKVRVASNINLRLGERADPTVSTFTIIGMPEAVGNNKNLIAEITRLNGNIDADI